MASVLRNAKCLFRPTKIAFFLSSSRHFKSVSASKPLPTCVSQIYSKNSPQNYLKNDCASWKRKLTTTSQFCNKKEGKEIDRVKTKTNEVVAADADERVARKKIADDPEIRSILDNILKDFEEHADERFGIGQEITEEKVHFTGADEIAPSFREQFQPFSDKDASVILDVHELELLQHYPHQAEDEEENFSLYREKPNLLEGLNLERGETGVFDVETLVQVLHKERAQDICVIEVPEELHYADYLVIASSRSPRHMKALSQFVRKLYKTIKDGSDPNVEIEGKNSLDWHVLDMRNIVLHIFKPEVRSTYDLESLWLLGSRFDDLTQHPVEDGVFDALMCDSLFWEETRPMTETQNVET